MPTSKDPLPTLEGFVVVMRSRIPAKNVSQRGKPFASTEEFFLHHMSYEGKGHEHMRKQRQSHPDHARRPPPPLTSIAGPLRRDQTIMTEVYHIRRRSKPLPNISSDTAHASNDDANSVVGDLVQAAGSASSHETLFFHGNAALMTSPCTNSQPHSTMPLPTGA